MAQQLPLYQIPMPQGQQQNYNLPPLQTQQPQVEPQIPDFVNNPNIDINTKRQMLNQINQQPQVVADVSPQSMAVAGANKGGFDWRGALGTLARYAGQIGQGMAGAPNLSQGLAQGMSQGLKYQQNIRQFDTMAPYFQQMGYDVSKLDPRRGGAGISTTPEKMIELESLIDQRKTNAAYRQMMAEARMQQVQQKDQATQTVGDLMLFNPEFRAMMNAQYDFRNGANAGILKRPISKEVLQNMMPKNVNMRYSGGITSRQVKTGRSDIYHHSNNSGGGGKKSGGSKKLIF